MMRQDSPVKDPHSAGCRICSAPHPALVTTLLCTNFRSWYGQKREGIWIWKEKLELPLQLIQPGLSLGFEVLMRPVSCTMCPNPVPEHATHPGRWWSWKVVCSCEHWVQNPNHWRNTNSWITKSLGITGFPSHLGTLRNAHHGTGWIFQSRSRRRYQPL